MRLKPVAAFVLLAALPVYAETPLSGYQQQIHDEVKTGLEGVEASLASVRSQLDAGDASAATQTYNTAVRNFNNHIRRLSQLPANHSTTAALREKATALQTSIKDAADAIKAGPAAKQDKPGAAAPANPPASNAKLNYQQVEKLKNARFYLKEIEPRAARIAELVAGTLDAEAIAEVRQLMEYVHPKMGYAVENLNALPGTHPEVAAESKRYNDLLAQLVKAQEAVEKAAPDAEKQVAALGDQMTNDLAMVESWSQTLGNPQFLFDNRPDDAIAAVGQLPKMRETLATMLQRWTDRATAKPNDRTAADMVRKLKYVDGQLTDLETYTAQQGKSLPGAIDADIARANQLIQTAVTEKRPAYFGRDAGIAQWVGYAEQKTKMLKAIDPAAGENAEKSLASLRDASAAAQKSLAQEIINNNKKPAERYSGPDVEALRTQVAATWKETYADDEILVVIFPTEGWSRTTRWDWSRGNQAFEKVDYDHLQARLYYKHDEKHAIEVPVNIYKDYMKGERIVIKPWEKETDTPVTRMFLLDNLK